MQPKHNRVAITRTKPSRPARFLIEQGCVPANATILDFGCGKGMDTRWFVAQGYRARGYDPISGYGERELPTEQFDVVFLNYVLNTLPTEAERLIVLWQAWDCVAPGGSLYLTVRMAPEVAREARVHGWHQHGDGWLTGAQTFQHGYTYSTLTVLVAQAALPDVDRMAAAGAAGWVGLRVWRVGS